MPYKLLTENYVRGKRTIFIAVCFITILGFLLDYITYRNDYTIYQLMLQSISVVIASSATGLYFFGNKTRYPVLFSLLAYSVVINILLTHIFFRQFLEATNFNASNILSRDLFFIYCYMALSGFISGRAHIFVQGAVILFIISLYAFIYDEPFVEDNYPIYFLVAIGFSVVMYFFVSNINRFIRSLEIVTNEATSLTTQAEERNARLEKYLLVQVELSRSEGLSSANQLNEKSLFEKLVKAAAENLKTQRVSIWLYNTDRSAIIRSVQYDNKAIIYDPIKLERKDYPKYFSAIDTKPFVLANDAKNYYATKEFTDSYLKPLGIFSMLDCPIIIDGESVGVICCEQQLDFAKWGNEEVLFVESLSDFISIQVKNERIQSLLNELNWKNQEIHHKNTEIIDSINYAKRIQKAILPSSKLTEKYLKEAFILYRPKDIIAGDFYWLEHTEDHLLFAVADCTGHGVPGALVSVVCDNALSRAFRLEKDLDPGRILDKTRELVIQQFEKSDEDVKDGMDISLCVINMNSKELRWAGANRPLWLIRNGELTIYNADSQHIGKPIFVENFKTNSIQLQKDDLLYMFTDGYIDQFGGPLGKKFKTSKLRELLLECSSLSIRTQNGIVNNTFDNWKGSEEQVDDVCMIGYRV
jgi:serine phosphatase RsbU (regulator of sigma subunit)